MEKETIVHEHFSQEYNFQIREMSTNDIGEFIKKYHSEVILLPNENNAFAPRFFNAIGAQKKH